MNSKHTVWWKTTTEYLGKAECHQKSKRRYISYRDGRKCVIYSNYKRCRKTPISGEAQSQKCRFSPHWFAGVAVILMQRLRPHPWRLKECGSHSPPAIGSRHWPTKHKSYPLQVRQRTTMEGGQSRAVVPSYLGWSIFNTLCCCLPLGIAAIVCSCRVGLQDFLRSSTAFYSCILRDAQIQKLYKPFLVFCIILHFLKKEKNCSKLNCTSIETNDICFLKAQNANALGESATAMDASRTAKILNVIGLVCGIILIIIFIALKATQQHY